MIQLRNQMAKHQKKKTKEPNKKKTTPKYLLSTHFRADSGELHFLPCPISGY